MSARCSLCNSVNHNPTNGRLRIGRAVKEFDVRRAVRISPAQDRLYTPIFEMQLYCNAMAANCSSSASPHNRHSTVNRATLTQLHKLLNFLNNETVVGCAATVITRPTSYWVVEDIAHAK